MRILVAAAAVSLAMGAPARAEPAFAEAVDRVIDAAIVPTHRAFAEAAAARVPKIDALCAAPSAGALEAARDGFADVLVAWSRVEMFRFGPARVGNRFEKIFYWPDRKGRGLRQIQRLLATEDASATTADGLAAKSVAVQGLPALEFVLFGTGADGLAAGAAYRCAYAAALARVVAANAAALLDGWTAAGGYADVMRAAGPGTGPYQTPGEAVQELLRALSVQLEVVRDLKVAPSLGDGLAAAKPKRAPFWRSDLTLATIQANLEGVDSLLQGGLNDALPAADRSLADSVAFELAQARRTVSALRETGRPWLELAATEETYQRLVSLKFPVGGAGQVIGSRYPQAMGLVLGFNSLDGD